MNIVDVSKHKGVADGLLSVKTFNRSVGAVQ